MGKGKGKTFRYVMRVGGSYTLFEFLGFNLHYLLRILKLFNIKTRRCFILLKKFFLKKNICFFKKSIYNFKTNYFNL